ncbi:MAG TPA: PQQ-binding-like beta-propeller repeat protein, partial [Gemmataceae bacterium]|nr:PQQ-binding-like beta-propeller repeat protein [Gemmataceae bacterium]
MENVGESFAAGIDKNTGENRWRIARPRGINWVSPLVIQNNGRAEVLFQSGEGLDAYDVATGKKLWNAPKLTSSAFASATTSDGVLFVHSAKFAAIRAGKTSDAKPEVLWETPKLRLGYCSPVANQGLVYGVTNAGIVNCLDAKTGAVLWNHRLEGTFAASPLLADGKLYVVNEKGVTTILRAGRELEVIATNPINDTILASPVASDGAIFLRSDGALYCIGKK